MAKHPAQRSNFLKLAPTAKKKPKKRTKTSKLLLFNTFLLLSIFLMQLGSHETRQMVKELIILTKGILY